MIIREIDEGLFVQAFGDCGRDQYFSKSGLIALYNFINRLYDGRSYELDVIALSCDFLEYDSMEDVLSDYDMSFDDIQENTVIIDVAHNDRPDSYIIQSF